MRLRLVVLTAGKWQGKSILVPTGRTATATAPPDQTSAPDPDEAKPPSTQPRPPRPCCTGTCGGRESNEGQREGQALWQR
jgi:hypothetical protein